MPTVRAHGIASQLPNGFDAKIFVRTVPVGTAYAVAQFATFPLPDDVGDFGSGAVNLMGPDDVFVTLFEYGPESLGTRLFARQGRPSALSPADFSPTVLRRGLPGQSGTQWFFTESNRPFTLYAVLGSYAARGQLVPRLNGLLQGITVTG